MQLRLDIAPLPIAELAPARFDSADPDEPFVLGCGDSPLTGRCGLVLASLRRAERAGAGVAASTAASLRTLITPCGVVRSARLDGVLVTERVALVGASTRVMQWTVDAPAEIAVAGFDPCPLAAGATATAVDRPGHADPDPAGASAGAGAERAFRVAAASVSRAVASGLRLDPSDGASLPLAWAKARLPSCSTGAGPPALPLALAALIAGRPEATRAQLEEAIGSAAFPLLAARYAASTGDSHGIGDLPDLLPGLATFEVKGNDASAAAIWLAGLDELERTATDRGDPRSAAEIRSIARRRRDALAGTPPGPATSALLDALRARSERMGTDDVAGLAWRTWAAFAHGRLRQATAGWRRLLAEAALPVRGAWPRRSGAADFDPEATALFVLTLAHGRLGIEPDAPRHRIRLAPRVPKGEETIDARGIPCGDATISLTVTADAAAVTLRVAQDEGAIPLTALLEPLIEGDVAAAFVDGRSAALDLRRHGEGTAVPVQLVLDAERTLRIERA